MESEPTIDVKLLPSVTPVQKLDLHVGTENHGKSAFFALPTHFIRLTP